MKDRHQKFVNYALMKRGIAEEKLNEYHRRISEKAEERRIQASLQDQDRTGRINRVYDALAERNEIKQAMYESSPRSLIRATSNQ